MGPTGHERDSLFWNAVRLRWFERPRKAPGPDGGFSTDERWDPAANPMGEGCLLSRLLAAENEAQRDGRQGSVPNSDFERL